jgi:hypothetical protein
LNSEPDYESYTYDELLDVLEHIDADRYPERLERIKLVIQQLSETLKDNPSTSLKETFRFTKKEGYCLSFFICSFLIVLCLFIEEVPISKSSSVHMESNPQLYWFALVIWGIISIYSGVRWLRYGEDADT